MVVEVLHDGCGCGGVLLRPVRGEVENEAFLTGVASLGVSSLWPLVGSVGSDLNEPDNDWP